MKTESILFFFVYLIGEMYWYSIGTPSRATFLCHKEARLNEYNHHVYINGDNFCDGHLHHCDNGEDEGFGCDPRCSKGKFACDYDQCFNITVRCNTIKDCEDGTDEEDCGDEVNVNNCTSEDKFLCKDGLRCLGLEFTCNNLCNCFDCSDENENCRKHDDNLLKKCPHAYFDTPNGPQCFCGSDNTNSSIVCDSIKNCEYSNIVWRLGYVLECDQRCIEFKRKKRQCSCYEGYTSFNGSFGSECRPTVDFAILYANENEIKLLNTTSLKTSTIVRGIDNCTLLTAANNYVYYATLSQDNKTSIFKKALNSGKQERVIETNFAITSIAVDYVTNNFYFTGNGSLSVCTSNGDICTQLKCCNVDVVTLAPKSGWMYYMLKQPDNPNWTYCPNGFLLARSNMDGSNETIHISHCFDFNISMEIDESKNVINLLQMKEIMLQTEENFESLSIHRIPINAGFEISDNMQNFPLHGNKIHRFSFHNDGMFYTMDGEDAIFYMKSFSSFNHYFVTLKDRGMIFLNDTSTSTVTDIYAYNAAIQRGNENPCEKASCSGLCLLKPEMHPSKYFLNHTCFCDGFTPSSVNHWCSNNSGRGHVGVWVIACISILIISCTIAYIFKKGNWRRYLPVTQ